jgi:H+/Cl- antiporter ClcA
MALIRKIRENMIPISGTIFVLSLIGTILPTIYFFFLDSTPEPLKGICAAPGAWNYWIITLSLLGLVIGGWYLYDTTKKKKKFEELMETNSRSKFMKNLPDLVDIAWYLGKDYEDRLEEKKKKLRVK